PSTYFALCGSLYVFFLHSTRAFAQLLTFSTRRSSDLAHMGAGAVTSNVKSDKTLVKIHAADGDIETGLKKVGAFLGDGVEVGCQDRKSTRLNSSHVSSSYAVFCLKKKITRELVFHIYV